MTDALERLTGVRERVSNAVRARVETGLAAPFAMVEGGVPAGLCDEVTEAVLDALGLGPDPEPLGTIPGDSDTPGSG